jgi:hypothetical protein
MRVRRLLVIFSMRPKMTFGPGNPISNLSTHLQAALAPERCPVRDSQLQVQPQSMAARRGRTRIRPTGEIRQREADPEAGVDGSSVMAQLHRMLVERSSLHIPSLKQSGAKRLRLERSKVRCSWSWFLKSTSNIGDVGDDTNLYD